MNRAGDIVVDEKGCYVDFAYRKQRGISSCPGDPEYDTEAVVGKKTQKELDARALAEWEDELAHPDTEPMTDAELVAAGAVDMTSEGFSVIAPLTHSG